MNPMTDDPKPLSEWNPIKREKGFTIYEKDGMHVFGGNGVWSSPGCVFHRTRKVAMAAADEFKNNPQT